MSPLACSLGLGRDHQRVVPGFVSAVANTDLLKSETSWNTHSDGCPPPAARQPSARVHAAPHRLAWQYLWKPCWRSSSSKKEELVQPERESPSSIATLSDYVFLDIKFRRLKSLDLVVSVVTR